MKTKRYNRNTTFRRFDLSRRFPVRARRNTNLVRIQHSYDCAGNWATFKQDTNGDTSWDLNQSRTHNAANELTAIDTVNTYTATDPNGNMTKVPKPETWSSNYNLTYDAWNRLTTVKDSDNSTVIASYQYNPLNHRVKKTVGTTTTKYFFNPDWQCVEEYIGTSTNPSLTYIWGTRYIDDLICRDRDTNGDGILDERLYSLADPNRNVIALTDSTGAVQERYNYNAFDKLAIYDASGTTRTSSSYAWTRTFTGQVYDPDTGIMLYRNRYYHPTLGRFVTRDPIGYEGKDCALYHFIKNGVTLYTDKFGFQNNRPNDVWDYPPGFWTDDKIKDWYDNDKTWPQIPNEWPATPEKEQPHSNPVSSDCPLTEEEIKNKCDGSKKSNDIRNDILYATCLGATGRNPITRFLRGTAVCSYLYIRAIDESEQTYQHCLTHDGKWEPWKAYFD